MRRGRYQEPGAHTLTCTARDNAGNERTVAVGYKVEYQILGFFAPVPQSKWKVPQTVPIKIALADANGRISDPAASALAAACHVTFSATGAETASGQCMNYDQAGHQFVFTWKLRGGVGPATIAATVAYPGSPATTTTKSLPITITT